VPHGGRRRVLAMVFDPVAIERALRHQVRESVGQG
jgi:hypothetical protein